MHIVVLSFLREGNTKLNKMEKYKVKANRQQLENLGISYDITGLTGELKHKYPTGFYVIEITHTYEAGTFTNLFDIPKTFLECVCK